MQSGLDIDYAAKLLREGEVVAFPTETVYGLGANAFDPLAIAKVFEMKERPFFDPLIVHIASAKQLDELFQEPDNQYIKTLVAAFWPGPLTIVSAKKNEVPDLVTSGLPTVAVRMPSHPIAIELLSKAMVPVAAPSANKFGCLSPTKASHIVKQGLKPAYIIDGGNTTHGIESTVISIEGGGVKILRHGAISEEELAVYVNIIKHNDASDAQEKHSPGMLKSHYSPRKPLFIYTNQTAESLPRGTGMITTSKEMHLQFHEKFKTLSLSENGDLKEVAANLFQALHSMEDDETISQIYIEPVPETGIGKAIMDRIKKASYNYSKTDG